MIQRQESGWFYAWCRCGVCGPPRVRKALARRDERAHASVCSGGRS
jgi:hypothetical protein